MQIEAIKGIKPFDIGVVDLDNTESSLSLIKGLENAGNKIVVIKVKSDSEAIRIANEKNLSMVMIIPHNYEADLKNKKGVEIKIYSLINSLSFATSARRANIRNFMRALNQQVVEYFVKELDPNFNLKLIREPIETKEFVVLKDNIQQGNASFIIAYISSQTIIIPVALLILIIFTGTMIASSVALEKENKTLETLLTVPVSRFTVILAKMLAAVIIATLFAFFFMFAMISYMSSFGSVGATSPQFNSVIKLNIDNISKILIGLSIFLSIVNALIIATLLALFAQDVKDAQATIMPLTIMILVPYFFAMFFDPGEMSFALKILTFLIPFSHTFFAFKFLLLGQCIPVILGNLYLFIFAIILLFIATKIFSSEQILTMRFAIRKRQ